MFKDLFVQLLQENNVTAYKLSRETGITEGLISNWKSGRQLPKYDSIKILCNYFNVSADYLLELIDASNVNTQHQSLTENEKEILRILNTIKDERQQVKFLGRIEQEAKEYTNETADIVKQFRDLNTTQIAAYGSGAHTQTIENPEEVSKAIEEFKKQNNTK